MRKERSEGKANIIAAALIAIAFTGLAIAIVTPKADSCAKISGGY